MKVSNFSQAELENYYNKNEIFFFNYRKCYILKKCEKKGFKFKEDKSKISLELPHTKKGRFFAFTPLDSYVISLNNKPPKVIKLCPFLKKYIREDKLTAKKLVIELKRYGFKSNLDINHTAIKDLEFKGYKIKSLELGTNFMFINYK